MIATSGLSKKDTMTHDNLQDKQQATIKNWLPAVPCCKFVEQTVPGTTRY